MRPTLAIVACIVAAALILLLARNHWNYPAVVLQTIAGTACLVSGLALSRLPEPAPNVKLVPSDEPSAEIGSNPKVAADIMRHLRVLQFLQQVEDRRKARLGRDISSEW